MLDRREVLKLLVLGTALPAFPASALATLRQVHRSLPASPALKIFTPQQDATVTAMAELILPATNTPGAKATRVNEFIDLVVADWFSEKERDRFLAGLAGVDARSQSMFQKDFVDATSAQQGEILRVLGDEMTEEAQILAAEPRPHRGANPEPTNNFYFAFRSLTLTGYFTSEAGFTQQLHEELIPGRFDGCVLRKAPAPSEGV
jgi:hypothetical protein